MRLAALAVVAIVLAAAMAPPRVARATVAVGQVAPDFTKTDLDNVSRTLSSYRGKIVLLAFIGYG
jgi:cytochrome oxidase Cu insertion factor (SCO1/SenC/PrrC family)